jgi:hypothetical protein
MLTGWMNRCLEERQDDDFDIDILVKISILERNTILCAISNATRPLYHSPQSHSLPLPKV